MESRLLEILVCPICKSSLRYDRQHQELICQADRLAFPVRDGVPIMLEDEARELADTAPSSAATASSPGSPSAPSTSAGTDTQS
ncbi:MAG: Trm112 family protein [Burkholderiaceae bacterium]